MSDILSSTGRERVNLDRSDRTNRDTGGGHTPRGGDSCGLPGATLRHVVQKRAARRKKERTMEFSILRRMGVLVEYVEDLPVDASYIAELHLVVVRAGLDRETREYCADWLLAEVCVAPSPLPSPRSPSASEQGHARHRPLRHGPHDPLHP
jgi:hypothetical protein